MTFSRVHGVVTLVQFVEVKSDI